MSLRLFAAIPVPDSLHSDLTRLQRGLPGARWRPPENFHLTLRFFGAVGEHEAEDLDAELRAILQPAFTLALRGADWFGKSEPHAVWLGVQPSDELRQLHERCERAARRAGLEPEKRKFKPHVTLAYLNDTPVDRLAAWCRDRARFATEPFRVTHFTLYQSWAHKGGPNIYEPIADYALR